MLSRVADNLYWMSRYLERAEHAARLLDVNLNLMLDESASSADRRWRRVLAALGNPPNLSWSGDAYQVAQILTFDPGNRSSITACVASARENARQVREEISSDQWQRLNRLFHQVTRHKPNETDDVLPSDFLLAVIEGVHLIQGVTDSTMSHGEGWHFIQVGRHMERACATVTLLGLYHREFWGHPDQTPEAAEYLEWVGLLRSCTAFEAYCKVYTADISPDRIIEFLLLNPEFPALGALLHRSPATRSRSHSRRGREAAGSAVDPAGRTVAGIARLRTDFGDPVAGCRRISAGYFAAVPRHPRDHLRALRELRDPDGIGRIGDQDFMFYSIQHLTKFHYASPVSESVMEARMHPRSEGNQRCLTFHLAVSPRCRVFAYRDHVGNNIHHFDIPGQHSYLVIVAESLLDMQPAPEIPSSLPADAWAEADAMVKMGDYWEMLLPSEFAQPTPGLIELARQMEVCRRDDPLSLLRELNQRLYDWFEYVPKSTKVDSPIDHAIETRQGVCQDFAHIMIALVRRVKIPCRYVSGYLYRSAQSHDRSVVDATHAWVEAFLPPLGWVGFDPTNCLLAGERHVRTAIGRDYADVPPDPGNLSRTNAQRAVGGGAGHSFSRAA